MVRKRHFLHILIKTPCSEEISEYEVIKILQLKVQGQNHLQISRRIEKSLSSIFRVLRSGGTCGTLENESEDKKKKMLRDDRMLLKMATVDNFSVSAIASNTRIGKSTAHRRIKA